MINRQRLHISGYVNDIHLRSAANGGIPFMRSFFGRDLIPQQVLKVCSFISVYARDEWVGEKECKERV